MARIKPPHYPIPDDGPDDYSKHWFIKSKLHVKCIENIIPAFIFETTYNMKGTSKIEGPYFHDFICGIPGDAIVNLSIDDNSRDICRWSQSFLAVTGKENYKSHIGGIHMNSDNSVEFKVKKASEHNPKRHHLNLNIELLMGFRNDSGTGVWMPFTFDPDVINPRPPGRILEDDELRLDGERSIEIFLAPPQDEDLPFVEVS